MKRIILGISVLLLLVQTAFAYTDEEFDRWIKDEKNPLTKQTFMCEKEVTHHKDYGSPQICIDSASLYKKQKILSTDEKDYYGEAYNNAGIIYTFGKGNKNLKKAHKMFLNAYKVGYGKKHSDVMHKLGYFNRYGKGTEQNKILAYKYYLEAAKSGNKDSQDALDSLCKESPWACK
jgi:TPR repeat protein